MADKNIILIMTDQQHFRTLGCNGCPEAKTPNLDKLASKGINFRNHFVSNPVCSPSRASIMTGKHITEHGLYANGGTLPPHETTLPQVLADNGYQTAVFGKMHLVPILSRTEEHPPYGFEIAEVAEGDQQLTNDAYFRWLRANHTEEFLCYSNEMFTKGHNEGYTSCLSEDCHMNTWIADRSIDFLKTRRDPERPFFLKMSFFDPHHAFNPCEPYASMFDDVPMSEPVYDEGSAATRPTHLQGKVKGDSSLTRDKARMDKILRAYHAMVAHIDKCVGDLLDALYELDLNETIIVFTSHILYAVLLLIVFTSDHGELMGNHGMLYKGPIMLDDLLRVPMIVSAPNGFGHAESTDELTSAVDIMPTILSLAGVPADAQPLMSGRRFVDVDGTLFPDGTNDFVLSEWQDERKQGATQSIRCLRTKTQKLVYYGLCPDDEGELYDYDSDPNEFFSRYHDADWQETRKALTAKLVGHYTTRTPRYPRAPLW